MQTIGKDKKAFQAQKVIRTFEKQVPEMSRNRQAQWLGCFGSAELEKMEEDCTHYAMTLNYVKNSL